MVVYSPLYTPLHNHAARSSHTLHASTRGAAHATACVSTQIVHHPRALCSIPLSHHHLHHAKHHPHPHPTDPRGSPSRCIPQTKPNFHHSNCIVGITHTSRPGSSTHPCNLCTSSTSCRGHVVCTSKRCPHPSSRLIRRLCNWPNLTG